jgi:hypothetical protein
MENFKQDIIEAVGEDKIIAVKIPPFGEYPQEETDQRFIPANSIQNKLVDYETALTLLDYEYNSGYGTQDCHDITMWSHDYVYYIHEYDGSTSIEKLDRNPV